jgi:hypothetical protein
MTTATTTLQLDARTIRYSTQLRRRLAAARKPFSVDVRTLLGWVFLSAIAIPALYATLAIIDATGSWAVSANAFLGLVPFLAVGAALSRRH